MIVRARALRTQKWRVYSMSGMFAKHGKGEGAVEGILAVVEGMW
jgi:hypothetical protein